MGLTATILNSVDEQIKLLNVAPQIMPRLQTLLADGNSNPDDILDLIKLDTALAARVIKSANTAFFNPGFRITNIEDAVTYLGYNEVYQIISMLAFARVMRSPLRHFGLEPGELWRRALVCALAMETLSAAVETDPRMAYTIGLLHGVGMLFLDRQLTAMEVPVPEKQPLEQDVQLMGANHAEVGAYVLRHWSFPEEITEPVRCQFDPLYCLTQGTLANLLHTAKHMMWAIVRPPSEGESAPKPDPLILTMINLVPDEYLEVLEETEGKSALLEVATIEI